MIKWLKNKLGITLLEQAAVSHSEMLAEHSRLINKRRIGRQPMRYDEIERARSRRKKGRA